VCCCREEGGRFPAYPSPTSLLCATVHVIHACTAAGKKAGGKKKKGLTLTPEQTVHLVRITGCLKFLSLLNVNRYRIAKLGALKVGGCVGRVGAGLCVVRTVNVVGQG
jgi:hypothetical protein